MCAVYHITMVVYDLTIVNVSHNQANGILRRRHLPTTVTVDGDLYAIHHTILASTNLIAES